jgi:hypothetical protein
MPNIKILFCVLEYPEGRNPFCHLMTLQHIYGIVSVENAIYREN